MAVAAVVGAGVAVEGVAAAAETNGGPGQVAGSGDGNGSSGGDGGGGGGGGVGGGGGGGADGGGPDLVFGHFYGYYTHLEDSNKRWAASTGQHVAGTTTKVPAAAAAAAAGAAAVAALVGGEEEEGEDVYDPLEESISADAGRA
jgi:hypothetical protein